MADVLSFNPSRALTANIGAAAAARAFFYDAGTTNLKTVYADVGLTTPHPSPLLADSAGIFAQVFTDGLPTKVVVQNSGGSTLYTLDPADATPIDSLTNFDTVTDLLADTRLTYSSGYFKVSAGDIVTAQGLRYEVAASGATDNQFATAGGVKLYIVPEAGGVNVKVSGVKGDGATDDTARFSAMTAAKIEETNLYQIPIGTYPITAQQSLTGYHHISGTGDQSQVKTSAGTAFAYTSQTGVFDDHPHNLTAHFRVTGDGTFAAYPNAQNGMTTGLSFATVDNIGSLASSQGMTFELHNVGKYVKKSYVHFSEWNHYRANKVGLKLEEVTSYTEQNSYFRYNSTAAVQIIGGQNVTISGGAIEGNPGVGIQYVSGASTWGQININDVYLESNGNEATGVWSVDVPFGSPAMVNVTGGNLWRNVASGVASGPYRLGDNAVIDGATINSAFYVKKARVRNTRGNVTWNTFGTEDLSRLYGLTEPTTMLEFDPAHQEYDFSAAASGAVFCAVMQGKGSVKTPGISNIANYVYPYGFSASGGAVGSANAALNYGDGDFYKVQFAASVGSFSSNYVTIGSFPDTTKPYRTSCVIFYPESDCEIGIVQSVGNQATTAFYALRANTYYRMIMMAFRPMTAGSTLRVFPIDATGPAVNFHPIWASQHTTHVEQLGIVKKLVEGAL